jgi:hypothetical protein
MSVNATRRKNKNKKQAKQNRKTKIKEIKRIASKRSAKYIISSQSTQRQ